MKLAILNTDTIPEPWGSRFGQYPAMFERALTPEFDALECLTFEVQSGDYPPDFKAFDGVLITGSRHSVCHGTEWIERLKDTVRQIVHAGPRLVGICFGHQVIAEALGGRVSKAPGGWCVGVQPTRLNDRAGDYGPEGTLLNLVSSHEDQVLEPPPAARVLASAPACPVSMTALDDRVLTFQGHPEFTRDYARALMRKQRKEIGEPLYREAAASLDKPLDHARVNGWIGEFFTRLY